MQSFRNPSAARFTECTRTAAARTLHTIANAIATAVALGHRARGDARAQALHLRRRAGVPQRDALRAALRSAAEGAAREGDYGPRLQVSAEASRRAGRGSRAPSAAPEDAHTPRALRPIDAVSQSSVQPRAATRRAHTNYPFPPQEDERVLSPLLPRARWL